MKGRKAIFKLNISGRGGNLSGLFISTTESVKKLIDSKTEVYFGEVLGKHSEVSGYLTSEHIELVTTDHIAISVFEKYKLAVGLNPFNFQDLEGENINDLINEMLG